MLILHSLFRGEGFPPSETRFPQRCHLRRVHMLPVADNGWSPNRGGAGDSRGTDLSGTTIVCPPPTLAALWAAVVA